MPPKNDLNKGIADKSKGYEGSLYYKDYHNNIIKNIDIMFLKGYTTYIFLGNMITMFYKQYQVIFYYRYHNYLYYSE